MPDARDNQPTVGHATESHRRELLRRADGQVEESSGPAVIDDAEQREIGALQADIGDLGDVAGAVEHHALLAVAVGLASSRNVIQAATNLLPCLCVEMDRVLQ